MNRKKIYIIIWSIIVSILFILLLGGLRSARLEDWRANRILAVEKDLLDPLRKKYEIKCSSLTNFWETVIDMHFEVNTHEQIRDIVHDIETAKANLPWLKSETLDIEIQCIEEDRFTFVHVVILGPFGYTGNPNGKINTEQ